MDPRHHVEVDALPLDLRTVWCTFSLKLLIKLGAFVVVLGVVCDALSLGGAV